jgi:uncharacterized membrane protein
MRLVMGALIFIVVAGFTHIVSLFALPRLVREDAFNWLAKDAPLHAMARVEPGRMRSSTHIDPNFTLAVCRYDLAGGPLRIRVPLSETFTAISFAELGQGIFASVSDSAATSGSLDIVLATPTQIAKIASLDEEDKVVEEIRMRAPRLRGLAILSVFVDRPSARERAEALLAQARCEQETLPE